MSEQVNNGGKTPGKGLGIAAMVIGIVAIILSIFTIGVTLGVIGAVLGVVGFMQAKKANVKNAMAIVGIVLGIAAIGISFYQANRLETALEDAGFTEEGFGDLMQDVIDKAEADAEAGH